MDLDQGSLVAALTEGMNDCGTSWIVHGPFQVSFIARRLLAEVPQLSGSAAEADGFARSPDGLYSWIFIDADDGSAAFIIPRDGAGLELREPLMALGPALAVNPCIYGNVNDSVWITLGAGQRAVVDAHAFLPE